MIPARLLPRIGCGRAHFRQRGDKPFAPFGNRLERDYSLHLDELQLMGAILSWRYEPMKFRLADRTWYSPDFLVVNGEGYIEFHEVKGGLVEDDARAKWKIAADMFGMFRWAWVTRPKKAEPWKAVYYGEDKIERGGQLAAEGGG